MPTVIVLLLLTLGLFACASSDKSDQAIPVNPHLSAPTLPSLALELCPKLTISNAPPADNLRRVLRESPLACVQGVEVMVAPAPDACLTSAFGPRGKGFHSGLDFQSKPAGNVVAAADGTLVIPPVRPGDFGRWLIIDHGGGVITSYSHLASMQRGLQPGQEVKMGDVLGIMGASGEAARAIHLHYEVRTGQFDSTGNTSRYFLLEKIDPFSKPGRC